MSPRYLASRLLGDAHPHGVEHLLVVEAGLHNLGCESLSIRSTFRSLVRGGFTRGGRVRNDHTSATLILKWHEPLGPPLPSHIVAACVEDDEKNGVRRLPHENIKNIRQLDPAHAEGPFGGVRGIHRDQ